MAPPERVHSTSMVVPFVWLPDVSSVNAVVAVGSGTPGAGSACV